MLKKKGRVVVVSYTFYGLPIGQKLVAVLHYIKSFGLPPLSAQNVSPAGLSKIAEEAGFSVKESKLMGEKLKTVCLVAIKPE